MTNLVKNDMASIFDSTYKCMITFNSDGIVTLFNKAAERITGLKATDMIGNPAADVIPNTRLHHVLSEGVAEIGQEQNLGNTVIVTNRVPIRDADGHVQGGEFDIFVPDEMKPRQEIRMIIRRRDGSSADVMLRSRVDTAIEIEYYCHEGILPYVLPSLFGGEGAF